MSEPKPWKKFRKTLKNSYPQSSNYESNGSLKHLQENKVKFEPLGQQFERGSFHTRSSRDEIFTGSESEEEAVEVNFWDIGSLNFQNKNRSQGQYQNIFQNIQLENPITEEVELGSIMNEVKAQHEFPKNKPIQKKRKPKKKVHIGEYYNGKIKKRHLRGKRTLNDVEEFFRCQSCMKDYLTLVGIYRHVRSSHLSKEQLQLFRLEVQKDSETGKTIKVIIMDGKSSLIGGLPKINEKQEKLIREEPLKDDRSEDIIAEEPIQKLKIQKPSQINHMSSFQNATHKFMMKKLPIPPTLDATAVGSKAKVVSLEKYLKVIEDYQRIFNLMVEKDQEYQIKFQNLIQHNSMLYRTKEKYKMRIQILESKLELHQISLEKNQIKSSKESLKNDDTKRQKRMIATSESDETSCELPEFSSFEESLVSEYNSSVEEVSSAGTKGSKPKIVSKGSLKDQTQKNGVKYDPEDAEDLIWLEGKNLSDGNQLTKLEQDAQLDESPQNISGQSDETAYFKESESDEQFQVKVKLEELERKTSKRDWFKTKLPLELGNERMGKWFQNMRGQT